MTQYSPQSYRETQILTATPQRLRLMLIEGAIRSANEAISAWTDLPSELAYEKTCHCRDIVFELLTSIDQSASPLNRQIAGLYAFLYRNLTLANLQRDVNKVREVVGVLEEERITWRQVCEKMPEAPEGWRRPRVSGVIEGDETQSPVSPHFGASSFGEGPAGMSRIQSQFSLDA